MMLVDAHFHAWRLDRADYGWLTPALAPIYRDVSIVDWERQSRPCGVVAGVLVQAAPNEAETAYLLAMAQAHESVIGVVGWVDLLAPDASQSIERLAAHPKLRGLRPMLQDIADAKWILQPALDPALEAMVRCGLVFDALVKPVHLPHIVELARRHPKLTLVIDHAGKPDVAGRMWQPWADDLVRVAAETSAVCKLSGLLTEAGSTPAPDAARRWAAHALRCFGPQRVLWGSDWPVLELAADYGIWWRETQAMLTPFDPAARAAVLGGNALRIYGRA